MSEQPASNVYDLNQRRSKADGSLEMGPETDVLFHASSLPRDAASVNNSSPFEYSRVVEVDEDIIAIHRVSRELSNLHIIRRYEIGENQPVSGEAA